jgi:hypothetical protein
MADADEPIELDPDVRQLAERIQRLSPLDRPRVVATYSADLALWERVQRVRPRNPPDPVADAQN